MSTDSQSQAFDRLGRYAPLTGLVFVVLVLVAILSSHSSPGSSASGSRVIAFYTAHHSSQQATDILFTIGSVFLLFFAASVYGFLRRSEAAGTLALLGLGGALLLALGFAVFSSIDFALADVPSKLSPDTARALNVLDSDFIFPLVIGAWTFGIAMGLAIVRSRTLPIWLGWTLIVIGIVTGTPASFVGLFAFLAWIVVTAVFIYRRSAPGVADRPRAVATA
jgi:hypothetical protein